MTDSDRSNSSHGVWTIRVKGGPAFWANVLSVLSAGVSADSTRHGGPSWQVFERMHEAEVDYEEPQ